MATGAEANRVGRRQVEPLEVQVISTMPLRDGPARSHDGVAATGVFLDSIDVWDQILMAGEVMMLLQPRSHRQLRVQLLHLDVASDGLDPLPLRMDALALEHVVGVAEEAHREPTEERRVAPAVAPEHDGLGAVREGREHLQTAVRHNGLFEGRLGGRVCPDEFIVQFAGGALRGGCVGRQHRAREPRRAHDVLEDQLQMRRCLGRDSHVARQCVSKGVLVRESAALAAMAHSDLHPPQVRPVARCEIRPCQAMGDEKLVVDGRDIRDQRDRLFKHATQGAMPSRRDVRMLVDPPMEVQGTPQHFSANRQTGAEGVVQQRLSRLRGVSACVIPPGPGDARVLVVLDQSRQDVHPGQQPLRHAQIRFWPVVDHGRGGLAEDGRVCARALRVQREAAIIDGRGGSDFQPRPDAALVEMPRDCFPTLPHIAHARKASFGRAPRDVAEAAATDVPRHGLFERRMDAVRAFVFATAIARAAEDVVAAQTNAV